MFKPKKKRRFVKLLGKKEEEITRQKEKSCIKSRIKFKFDANLL